MPPETSTAEQTGHASTRRILTLPRHGDPQHALILNVERHTARDGRVFARVVLREVSERRPRELTIEPSELRTLAVALQRAASDVERGRTGA